MDGSQNRLGSHRSFDEVFEMRDIDMNQAMGMTSIKRIKKRS